MNYEIREYQTSDLDALCKISLITGFSGKDATDLLSDPNLIANFYLIPYLKFEPEICFVLTKNKIPVGYIIGTKDSEKFSQKCDKEWIPELKKKYPLRNENDKSFEANIIKRIHKGHFVKDELKVYPAQLHINLLPETQGSGFGRKLVERFIAKLKELNTTALHLEVGKTNSGAIKFYEKIGFHIIKEYEYSIAYGMKFE